MSETLGEMFDVRHEFERAMALVRAPWWHRLLHRPAKTFICAAALRMRTLMRVALQVRARTFFQEEMLVALPEESACQIFRDGIIEEDVTSFLLSHLDKGMTFIDVGANLGYFTLLAATLVGPSGMVHAFEPARQTCRLLRHNTHGHPNVTVCQQALWSERTTMTFHDYGPQYSAVNSLRQHRLIAEGRIRRQQAYDVECLSLDDYCAGLHLIPDFIKIDAETAEPQILRGSTHTITRHAPMISLEVWDDEARNSREDIAFLLAHGYAVFEYQTREIIPHRLKNRYAYSNLLFVHPRHAKGQR